MQGQILQISISPGGIPKRPVASAFATRLGLTGDAHSHPTIHGGRRKAILLIASEVINHLIARGYPVYPGAMGENITTAGIDVQALRLGDRLRAGAALIEITQPRGPCSALNIFGRSIKAEIYDDQVRGRDSASLRWGMSGFYASVIEEGEVRSGDAVELLGETG